MDIHFASFGYVTHVRLFYKHVQFNLSCGIENSEMVNIRQPLLRVITLSLLCDNLEPGFQCNYIFCSYCIFHSLLHMLAILLSFK